MNWVKVLHPKQRDVRADGEILGKTNRLLFVGEDATLRFDLGEPLDYKPKSRLRRITGSSRKRPIVIEFEAIEP